MAAASLPDRDGAVREVAQVYELIKTHQPLLLVAHADEQAAPSTTLSTTTLVAQNLLSEALRALNVALSFMKQQQPAAAAAAAPASIKAEPQVLASSSPANGGGSPAADGTQASTARRAAGKRRRTEEDRCSRIDITAVPYEDGYQWRKYGEKKIHGAHFTRSYFRCTYKYDLGCPARKQIQQKDGDEPPMFQVTYSNDHTCNVCATRTAARNSNLALLGYDINAAGISYPDAPAGHGGSRMIKQEPQAAPAPLAAEAASDVVTPCQEAFPINGNPGGVSLCGIGIPSTAATGGCSGNISAVSCHELEHRMGQTTTTDHEPAPGDDTFFYDPHLLLLYDSFKYY